MMAWWKGTSLCYKALQHKKSLLSIVFEKNFYFLKFSKVHLDRQPFLPSNNFYDRFIQNSQKSLRHFVPKIYHLFFCTKKSTKNRTTWIFTNSRIWCIIKSRVRTTDPRRLLIISCTTAVFPRNFKLMISARTEKRSCAFFYI